MYLTTIYLGFAYLPVNEKKLMFNRKRTGIFFKEKLGLNKYINCYIAEIIMLYPANSIITKEGWKGQEIFILVHGQ